MKEFMKRWCSFSGRCRRLRYFLCAILAPTITLIAGIVLLFIIFGILGLLGVQTNRLLVEVAVNLLFAIWTLFFLVSGLSFVVRRLHDINLSGWWILLPVVIQLFVALFFPQFFDGSSRLVQLFSFWPAIFLLCMPGTNDKNNYGVAPEQGFT